MVQRFGELLHTLVRRIIEEEPVQRTPKVPFDKLPELIAHEVQLFADARGLIKQQQSELLKLLFIAAMHPADERTLAAYYLVVREGKYVFLRKRINHREGELVMMMLSE